MVAVTNASYSGGSSDASAATVTATAMRFDRHLGNPRDDASAMSFRRSLERDREAAFPAEAATALDAWGLPRYYIPREFGGELDGLLLPAQLVRHVARRDLTAAVGHGKTFLGAVCAWVARGPAAERMASIVSAGRPVSWGLTEQGRGSDLSSSATTASLGADHIVLDGGKWPIGNATRGRAMTVLARTDSSPGPRALSLVLVDKERVDPSSLSYRPRLQLHGIRGADISGIDFTGTRVDAGALIGAPGQGLELVLKSLQLTRTLCSALSLGSADQAIDIVLNPESGVDLRPGKRTGQRAIVGRAIADLLFAEAVGYTGVRHIHSVPEEMALESAFVKFLVPDAVDLMYRDLARVLGGGAQVIGTGGTSRFEKASRDNRVVGIFDGNSVVNLNVMINEFPNIAKDDGGAALEDVIASLGHPAHAERLEPGRLRLMTRRGSSLLRALPGLADALDDGRLPRQTVAVAAELAAELGRVLDAVRSTPRAARPPTDDFVVAERLALLFGAAASIAVYVANRDRPMTGLWTDGAWLRAVLSRVASRLGLGPSGAGDIDELLQLAAAEHRGGLPVSLLPDWADAEVWR